MSCYADPAVWLEPLLRLRAIRVHSVLAMLAGLPPSTGVWLPPLALAKQLVATATPQEELLPPSRCPGPSSNRRLRLRETTLRRQIH